MSFVCRLCPELDGESCTTPPSPCLLPGVFKVAAGETGKFLLFKKKMKKNVKEERKLLFEEFGEAEQIRRCWPLLLGWG